MNSFCSRKVCYPQVFLEFCQHQRVKKLVYSLNILVYSLFCILVLFFWCSTVKEIFLRKNRIAYRSMFLFSNFRIVVGILFGSRILSRFKEEKILETSVLSVGLIRDNSIFRAGKCDRGLNIYSAFSKIVINGICNVTWISDCFIVIAVGVVWLYLIEETIFFILFHVFFRSLIFSSKNLMI